jgi:hypothetical protein
MKSNETIKKNKREPEAPLPLAVHILGVCWGLVFAWEFVTSHNIELLNVIGVASMVGIVLMVWIARKYKSANK